MEVTDDVPKVESTTDVGDQKPPPTAAANDAEPAASDAGAGPSSSKTETPEDKAKVEMAYMHLVQGKRHLLIDDVPSAVSSLEEAVKILAETYGEMANECAEAYLHYGKALLAQSRLESGVLGVALDGVNADESELESSQISDPEHMKDDERKAIMKSVDEALEENFEELKPGADVIEKGAELQNQMDHVIRCLRVVARAVGKEREEMEKLLDELDGLVQKTGDIIGQIVTKDSSLVEEAEEAKEGEEVEMAEPKQDEEKGKKEEKEKPLVNGEEKPVVNGEEKPVVNGEEKALVNGEKEKPLVNGEKEPEAEKMETEESSAAASSEEDEEESGETEEKPEEGASAEEEEEDEGEETTEKQNEGEEKDDDVTTLQVAWETLELAKIILTKDSEGRQDKRLKLAQAHLSLGEVGLEMETYDQAIADFKSCLQIQKQYLEPSDRLIAETHYNLGNAFGLKEDFDSAIGEYDHSKSVLEARMEVLKKSLTKDLEAALADPFDEVGAEIKELKAVIPDIDEKISDVKASQAEWKRKTEMATQGGESSGASSSTSSTPAQVQETTEAKPVNDISHLIRKKRKADEPSEDLESEPSTKVAKPSENGVAEENGTATLGSSTPQVVNGN